MHGLILVPGLDGTAELFYRQIPILSRRFRVSTFPLPDDRGATMEDLVAGLAEVIDRQPVGPGESIYLCGESFGGALGLSFALANPGRVAGLIILNSFSRVRRRVAIHLGPAFLKLMPWGAMPLLRPYAEPRLHTSNTLPEDIREFRRRALGTGKRGYIRRLEILRDFDLRDRLPEITTPTLFLAADQDRLVPSVSEARFMTARMPNASMRVLEGYGHVCMIHHDFDLLGHVDSWLANGR